MAQIFHPSTNTISRVSIFGFVFFIVAVLLLLGAIDRSFYVTEVGLAREQPIQFSHDHHVGGLGIDCRYCHTTVERSSFAGIPATEICMNCHSQIWATSDMLRPVRESLQTGSPIRWNRVHELPDFSYFDHSIHVNKGVGCVTCHGRVDQMPLTSQAASLQMEWCLACHRNPSPFLRPRQFVFDMEWQPPPGETDLGQRLMRDYKIKSPAHLTSCSICHR
jgi:hypothetical protein